MLPHHRPPHPPHHPRPPGPHPHGLPASQVLAFMDDAALDAVLAPLVPQAGDRAFVLRCLVGEGPIHHRGANYVLLQLLAQALVRAGRVPSAPAGDVAAVPMRLPPHLGPAESATDYPLPLPLKALRDLAGGDEQRLAAMVDCLTDGPPQHALANVAMVALLEVLLDPVDGEAR